MRLKIFYLIFTFSHENMKIRSFGSRLFFIYLVEKKWRVLKLTVRIHKSHFGVLWTTFTSVICHKYPRKSSNINIPL